MDKLSKFVVFNLDKAAKSCGGSSTMPTNWAVCVSTATSLLSTSWREWFFATSVDARVFARLARENGYATLVVTPEEY